MTKANSTRTAPLSLEPRMHQHCRVRQDCTFPVSARPPAYL
ncbi:MAG: hypothetical protein ACRD12_10660 [Acidimicrobiales bacterium]